MNITIKYKNIIYSGFCPVGFDHEVCLKRMFKCQNYNKDEL